MNFVAKVLFMELIKLFMKLNVIITE